MKQALALKGGEKLSATTRLEYIQEIAEDLDSLDLTRNDIRNRYKISWPTASEWYSLALQLREKLDNGISREGMRGLQRAQIERMLTRLHGQLDHAQTLDDQLKIHDRIIKYQDARARIMGLNSETTLNLHAQVKPLQIVIDQQDTNTSMSHNVDPPTLPPPS